MANKQKTFVYTLIFLLTVTGTLSLFTPSQAETWTDITLPYTITQSGNYRISGAFNGSVTALSVNASNVAVDGQNNLISLNQSEGDYAIAIAPNSRNVLLKNINQTGADYGVYAEEGNFTVTDSLFTNNAAAAVFAFNVTNFIVIHSRTSENQYGIVAIDCSNFTVTDCHVKSNEVGVETVLSSNFTISDSYFNNNTQTVIAQNCTNMNLNDSILTENNIVLEASFTTLSAQNISVSNNLGYGLRLTYSDSVIFNSKFENNSVGAYSLASNLSATYCSFSYNLAVGLLSGFGNGTLLDCALDDNYMYGLLSLMNNSTTIDDCRVKNSEYGLAVLGSETFVLRNSLIFNNSYAGLLDEECPSSIIAHNNFTQNGFSQESQEYGGGALFQVESNSTVTDNIFKDNYEVLLIGGYNQETSSTLIYNYNTFTNNSYTFDFSYSLPSNSTNLQIYFYNNYVNDVAYISPLSFMNEGMAAPTPSVLHLNTTLQTGQRVTLDGARMIGGNYWAHPNGTGPSQTGIDVDKDGFLDTPFDLFGNQTVLDYLPYSSSFQEKIVNLTISPEAASVKAGQSVNYTATATDKYGNSWNVTADYTLNGNPCGGSLSIIYPGAYSVEAFYGGQTATATLYVTSAEVDRYVVITPDSITAGSPFLILIAAVDAYSNIVTDFSGTVTLSSNNGAVSPSTSSAFTYGKWFGNVTVSAAESFTISVSDGNGKTGTSSAVTVNQPTTEPTPTPTPTESPTTQPTANPTDSPGSADSYWWAWYAAPSLALLVLVAAGVYFIKRPKKPLTQ